MGPQNVPVGDQSVDQLPRTQVPERDLEAEKKAARFTRTEDYKALKKFIDGRIEFYERFMPGSGISIAQLPNEERGYMWLASSVIIDEFRGLLADYERAAEAVKDNAAS